jgi:hypothetical protein
MVPQWFRSGSKLYNIFRYFKKAGKMIFLYANQ